MEAQRILMGMRPASPRTLGSIKVKPNLFIIGAMKAGTSSLHSYLSTHPEIFMSRPKELAFHSLSPEQHRKLGHKPTPGNDLRLYLDAFAAAGDRAIVGESSTAYTKLPQFTGVAERIHNFNPAARCIYVMRNPLERTISHYWWMVRFENETRDIYTAITSERMYIQVSDYAMQLAPYLNQFGPHRVQILTFEQLVSEPRHVLTNLFAWLGVDSDFTPPNLGDNVNETPAEVIQFFRRNPLHRLRMSKCWDVVGPFTPPFVRAMGRRFTERRIDRSQVPIDKVVEYLAPIVAEQKARLQELLSRSFPEWETQSDRAGTVTAT
jgi:hypothetical protein